MHLPVNQSSFGASAIHGAYPSLAELCAEVAVTIGIGTSGLTLRAPELGKRR